MISTARFSIIFVALLFAACVAAPNYIARPVEIALPARPAFEPILGSAFACPPDVHAKHPQLVCISNATYGELVERMRGYKNWGLQLEAIIKRNNARAIEARAAEAPP